jgi:hypothetical protein
VDGIRVESPSREAPCDARRATQRWAWANRTAPGPPTALGQAPCSASDALQGWDFAADGTLRSWLIGSDMMRWLTGWSMRLPSRS